MKRGFVYWLPVLGQLWYIGERLADRIRARRRARRREHVRCTPDDSDLFDDSRELYRRGRRAYRDTRGRK